MKIVYHYSDVDLRAEPLYGLFVECHIIAIVVLVTALIISMMDVFHIPASMFEKKMLFFGSLIFWHIVGWGRYFWLYRKAEYIARYNWFLINRYTKKSNLVRQNRVGELGHITLLEELYQIENTIKRLDVFWVNPQLGTHPFIFFIEFKKDSDRVLYILSH